MPAPQTPHRLFAVPPAQGQPANAGYRKTSRYTGAEAVNQQQITPSVADAPAPHSSSPVRQPAPGYGYYPARARRRNDKGDR